MDLNLIKLIFLCFAIIVGITSFLIHFDENYLPIFLRRSFRHGKYAEKTSHKIVEKFEVPKRYFSHFYLFAAPLSTTVLLLCIYRYFYLGNLPEVIFTILDFLFNSSRKALVTSEQTITAITMITIQCWKRLYETHCVSVYSDAKMNISHYIVGFIHYIGTITCIIGESSGFVKGSDYDFHWSKLNSICIISAVFFLLSSYEQLKTNFILAHLRKNEKGVVVTKSYKIPNGRLFQYITAPLQLTEIIMYFTLTIILWQSSSFYYIFIWVLVNQTETAISSHRWYKKTFKNYPNHRKIYIPFLI
ncbi:polyprenol reductase [Microplitis mediator]|uniref:polyprenol reductase n=1 Tax=Microplitis mediator TaxID=375433 RepID=UPI0025547E6D|nr:polyprenol reductase [Microplitis mediator]